MNFQAILDNRVLWTVVIAWFLAQLLKIPIDFILNRKWKWSNFFAAGGMPSSHSALITSAALATGFYHGFDSGLFALALAIAMIVVYDATGVRRQAGIQARRINLIVAELLKGHPLNQEQLRVVIGHTPIEALGGVLLGLAVALGFFFFWQ